MLGGVVSSDGGVIFFYQDLIANNLDNRFDLDNHVGLVASST